MPRRYEHVSRSRESMRAIIAAGGVVYRKNDDGSVQFLLLKSKRGHYWDFPKGRREKGEDDVTTACREIQEETGVKNFHLMRRLNNVIRYWVRRGSHLIPKEVRLFLVQFSRSVEVKLSHEHIAYKWLNFEEAVGQVTHNNLRPALKEAYIQIINKD